MLYGLLSHIKIWDKFIVICIIMLLMSSYANHQYGPSLMLTTYFVLTMHENAKTFHFYIGVICMQPRMCKLRKLLGQPYFPQYPSKSNICIQKFPCTLVFILFLPDVNFVKLAASFNIKNN